MKRVYKNACVNGKITDITVENGVFSSFAPTKDPGVDLGGKTVRAGLFDIHAHGCIGFDTMEGGVAEMSRALAVRGITSWLPTTMTMPEADIARATAEIPKAPDAARVRGYHLEGPFIAASRKGAQNEEYLHEPDEGLLDLCPHAKLLTLAPELPGSTELILAAAARGVKCAVGHTDADYETALAAIKAGADCLTHTFNAMPPFSHRAPGPVGAALTGGAYVQVISDGVHLHPSVVLALYKMFGPDRMILISDMIRATGLSDGRYMFGGQPIVVTTGKATLENGVLAGSTTYLDDMVRRAISFGIPEEDAFRMASETPARYLGMPCGELREGFDADFGVWDGLTLLSTVIGGEIIK